MAGWRFRTLSVLCRPYLIIVMCPLPCISCELRRRAYFYFSSERGKEYCLTSYTMWLKEQAGAVLARQKLRATRSTRSRLGMFSLPLSQGLEAICSRGPILMALDVNASPSSPSPQSL